ncbi:HNH endonuclease [Sphingobacterium sp. ML3W]|uniref:HNH endonuclease n=1 Tax=Sphingobacterium sp. ML3W TaxID=1538644 RepID=UPI00249C8598|nr:HNH endonuclease [Sphingobacterium sp. ML3W]WFA79683.1 HNH endonuclease [Sphingobacterium sp. ML3W]
MRPKIQKPITFKNNCGCIVNTKVLEKAMIWYCKFKTLKSAKTIFMHGKYPAVSCYNDKIHVHRLIMCYVSGYILPSNLYVHHKDGNKLNSSIDNLEIINASYHQSIHNNGKVLSDNHKKLISEAIKKRRGISTKERTDVSVKNVNEMFQNGNTITDISRHFSCGWSTIKRIINNTTNG